MDVDSNRPALATIAENRKLIAPYILKTPVHDWGGRELGERLAPGTRVNLKLELFQYSGTFKPRGALSVMLRLDRATLQRGVTAVSAGNHAIATAYAARCLHTSAKVVMLASANPARIERCRAFGAEVLIAADGRGAFEQAAAIAREEGRILVHPFEGPYTALGTATLGMEWLEQAGRLDAVIIPIGGGGLCAGVSTAVKLMQPHCRVIGVEPHGANTMYRSFAEGRPIEHAIVNTIADSLGPPYALPYSYRLCRENVDELVLVDDEQIRDAMALMFREMKLVAEPAGATSLAGLLGPQREKLAGRRVGVLVCGSNIDIEGFVRHIMQAQGGLPR